MNKYKIKTINGERYFEHRLIMEDYLGRNLTNEEVVHHLDGNKENNNINNLILLSREDHGKIHSWINSGCPIFPLSYIPDSSYREKECLNCGEKFITNNIKQKFCSNICCNEFNSKAKKNVSKEELETLIKTKSLTEIGKEFRVSGNAVKKWLLSFDIPLSTIKFNRKNIVSIDQECKNCGKIFHDDHLHDFCSIKCSKEYSNPLLKMDESELIRILNSHTIKEAACILNVGKTAVKTMRKKLKISGC